MLRKLQKIGQIGLVVTLTGGVIAFSSAPVARAVGPSTWWVATSGTAANPASGGTSCVNPSYVGGTDASIQAAIDGATAGDEVRICSGTYNIGSTVNVDKNITLTGEGATLPVLDGGNARRIMTIGTGGLAVTINALHFRNARVTGDGESGAAIKGDPAMTLNVIDSYFYMNTAVDAGGGAISMAVDGEISGELHVLRSTFYKNHGLDGGAIVMGGIVGESSVKDSTFVSNSATRAGGAISASFASLTASHSTFVDNTNADEGFASTTWVVKMKGNIVANSPAVSLAQSPCYFNANPSVGDLPVDNVSTDARCLGNGQSAVSYSSLQLGFLAPHGARVPTLPIGAGSAAIDAVSTSSDCAGNDQMGTARAGASCDAGSSEYIASPLSISASSVITLISGRLVSNAPTITATGFTGGVAYRVATELGDELPGGVSLNASDGTISGTPNTTFAREHLVVTGSDTTGNTASVKLVVSNCLLSQSSGKYQISSKQDLEIFEIAACGRDADYLQTANISWNEPWQSLVTGTSPFTGSYDGGGHSITGLEMSAVEAAFIPRTNGATIENLSFTAEVTGNYASAGLVQIAVSTTIRNVHGTGTITNLNTDADDGCMGGLAGEANQTSHIVDSSFEGTINAPVVHWNGGIAGCLDGDSVIERSYFQGTVKGKDEVGGLVGWMSNSEIRDSYAVGSVVSTGVKVGGLVGSLGADSSDLGGLAIENSYSAVNLQVEQGAQPVGALVGVAAPTSIATSFWEEGLSGVVGLNPIGEITPAGESQPSLTATPPASMKSYAFFETANWSIVDGWANAATSPKKWGICDERGRPFLLWEYSADPCVIPQVPPQDPAQESSNPTPPAGDVAPSAPAPSSSAGSSTPASAASSSASSATSASSSAKSMSVLNPEISKGGVAVFAGKQQVSSSLVWSNNSMISGKVGGVNLSLVFDPLMINRALSQSYVAGSFFTLSLRGLKPTSTTSVTLFSTPTKLGRFAATAKGTLNTKVMIPLDTPAGAHRIRLQMFNRDGVLQTVWLGIEIRSGVLTLPATGSSNGVTLSLAMLLLFAGIACCGVSWCRPKMRSAPMRTE